MRTILLVGVSVAVGAAGMWIYGYVSDLVVRIDNLEKFAQYINTVMMGMAR